MKLRKSQKYRILSLLKERGSEGVKVYELIAPRPDGLGCSQYGARIYDLRHEGYTIVNRNEKFVLEDEPVQPEEPKYEFNNVTMSYEETKHSDTKKESRQTTSNQIRFA